MKHICICGHNYTAHFNGNVPDDLACFYCDCKEFKCEDDDCTTAIQQAKQTTE